MTHTSIFGQEGLDKLIALNVIASSAIASPPRFLDFALPLLQLRQINLDQFAVPGGLLYDFSWLGCRLRRLCGLFCAGRIIGDGVSQTRFYIRVPDH